MAALVTQHTSGSAGLSPSFAAASSGGDTYTNTGKETLQVRNTGAADITVTLTAVAPCNQGFLHNLVITAPAGGTVLIGPLSTFNYNDSSGNVSIGYSAVASVAVAVTAP